MGNVGTAIWKVVIDFITGSEKTRFARSRFYAKAIAPRVLPKLYFSVRRRRSTSL